MSWNVRLMQNGVSAEIVEVRPHLEGGVIEVGGCSFADMSVTYNYSALLSEALGQGFVETFNGQSAGAVAPLLMSAIIVLGGDHPGHNYWAATPGNTAHALAVMLSWALQHPDAIWHIS